MNISELSIRRPVLSTVLTLIILLFGIIGYSYLGVREYPSVDNPIISVSCSAWLLSLCSLPPPEQHRERLYWQSTLC